MKIGKVEITHPDKIIYPKSKITKKDVINYYIKVSNKILPYVKDRPIALERCVEGAGKMCFYQKNAGGYFPKWIKTKKINGTEYVVCNDKDTLVYLANQDTLIFHHWLSRIDKIDYPEVVVWDIDPPNEKKLSDAVQATNAVKKILDSLELKSYLLSTGQKGFHIIVPIKRDVTFNETKKFSRRIAEIIEKINPDKFTTEQRINKRKGRVFIDYLRNARAQLKVVPYSLRAKEPGTIAMPLSWNELKPDFKFDKYTIKSISRYLEKNPWKVFSSNSKSIKLAMKKLEEYPE